MEPSGNGEKGVGLNGSLFQNTCVAEAFGVIFASGVDSGDWWRGEQFRRVLRAIVKATKTAGNFFDLVSPLKARLCSGVTFCLLYFRA